MEFTECVKERLTLTLKSGLLCAALLSPVAALAESLETVRGEGSSTTAVDQTSNTNPSTDKGPSTTAVNQTSSTNPSTDKGSPTTAANQTSNTNPSTDKGSPTTAVDQTSNIAPKADSGDAADIKPADRKKAAQLSQHLQSEYQVPEQKAQKIVREAIRNGKRHDVDPELILAIIAVESMFKERAVSRVGARGLMQVLPRSHKGKIQEIGGTPALFDPAKNIHTGSQILVEYLEDHSGNLRRALLNYNGSLGKRSSFPDKVIRIYRSMQRVTVEG